MFIREACIKANPSIKDLVFGCQIKVEKGIATIYEANDQVIEAVQLDKPEIGYRWAVNKPRETVNDFEIIGRPIRLADVLLAVKLFGRKRVPWMVDEMGFFWARDNDKKVIFFGLEKQWDLFKDDLTQQSEETIDFIYELLHGK